MAILGAALALRTIYYLAIRRTACLDINLDPISDMEAFHRWALTIVQGDWLGRSDFHPFHPWQTAVAPPEMWAQWYGHVFHQEPLYPYFVALVYLFAPRAPGSVIVVQLALGAAACALTYLAARRIFSERAALLAGMLSVFYGPYLYYESLMLRDTLLIPIDAALLWVLLEARSRRDLRNGWGWWAAAGLIAGIAYDTKATILVFFAGAAVLLVAQRGPGWSLPRAAPAFVMIAAFIVPVVPLVARNLVVGAPPFKVTTRGPIEFINGNNRWHVGIGWFEGDAARVQAYAGEVLARAGGRLLPTVEEVLGSWADDPLGLIRLQVVKTGYFFAPFEMPNNASYPYFRQNSVLLRRGVLSFYWISPLALIGLAASWPRRRDAALLYLFLACGVGITVAFYVIARFRAPLMPGFLMLAGAGLSALADMAGARRWGALGASCLLLAAGFAANQAAALPDRSLIRPQDYMIAIQGYESRGMNGPALAEAERARARFPAFPHFHRAAGFLYAAQGRREEALEALQQALARDPADAEVRREIARLERESAP